MTLHGETATAAAAAAAATQDPDIGLVRRRWFDSLLPADAGDVRAVMEAARGYARALRPDGTWPDVAYADTARSTWGPADHLERLHVVAKAGALLRRDSSNNSGSSKGDAAAPLDDAAHRALGWWLDHDPQNPNWWWNQIGVPTYLSEILVFLSGGGAAAPPDLLARADPMFARSKPGGAGANLVWLALNQVTRGLLGEDTARVAENYRRVYGEIRSVDSAREGIQADRSFHQHGTQLYSGGYGAAFANDCARFTAFAWGTRFQIPPDRGELLMSYLLDGQQWMIRGRTFDHSAVGREITREGKVAAPRSWVRGPIAPVGAAYALPHAIALLAAALPAALPRRREIAAFASRLRQGDTPRPANEAAGHRHFWDSDYAAHRREGYLASVRTYSVRTQCAEIVNGEGATLHHVADGAMLLYRIGDEYRDIFPLWDWRRVPGTTAEQDEPALARSGAVARRGKTDFVGGVSDGDYGAAVFDFVRDTLRARKSWFFFDDEIVCLGAGIACDSPWPLVTTVSQCRARGPVAAGSGPRGAWRLHDGVGYLFFPPGDGGPAEPKAATEPRTGRWSDIGTGSAVPVTGPVFTLWLEHGVRPQAGRYAYVVLPNAAADTLRARAAGESSDPIRIAANTPAAQAVFHAGLGILQAAFYAPGAVAGGPAAWNVAADQPCAVCLRRTGAGGMRIAVSNPRNLPLRVTLLLDRRLTGPGCSPAPDGGGTRIVFDLPGGPAAGQSVVRTFSAA